MRLVASALALASVWLAPVSGECNGEDDSLIETFLEFGGDAEVTENTLHLEEGELRFHSESTYRAPSTDW
jgi:hypothetical protein